MEQKNILVVLIILVIAVVAYIMLAGDSKDSSNVATNSGSEIAMDNNMQDTNAQIDSPSMGLEAGEEADMTNEHSNNMTSGEVEKSVGSFQNYNAEAVASSQAEHIVLHFSATWCPTCVAVEKDINKNLDNIPSGLEIYRVDYDTELKLRKKYGVTIQHTFVEVDSAGNLIQKWTGGNTLATIVAKL